VVDEDEDDDACDELVSVECFDAFDMAPLVYPRVPPTLLDAAGRPASIRTASGQSFMVMVESGKLLCKVSRC
jgi:hypothetical protein